MLLRTIGVDDPVYTEQDATPSAVRAVFNAAELWYGAEMELLPTDSSLPSVNAVSVTDPCAGPDDPGEFLLALADNDAFYSDASGRRHTREETLNYFLRYAAGDRTWLNELSWVEIVDGKPTGRQRSRSG